MGDPLVFGRDHLLLHLRSVLNRISGPRCRPSCEGEEHIPVVELDAFERNMCKDGPDPELEQGLQQLRKLSGGGPLRAEVLMEVLKYGGAYWTAVPPMEYS